MSGFITKGFKLGYKSSSSATSYTDLTDLQEFPDLGGDVDDIEITTLDDDAHVNMNGLKNYGSGLAFKFLYDKTQFSTLKALSGEIYWQCTIPDGSTGQTKITFTGECSIKLDGKGVNDALTYTLTIKPASEMVFA